jgi:HAD superfamily hydrolase (TIGR01549 family)
MSLSKEIKAILFDLDGTLLEMDMEYFVPQYLKLLANNFTHLMKPSKFISKLMKASTAVDKNNGPHTNEEVFAEAFFPLIGYSPEEIMPIIDRFYIEDFPKLQQYTHHKPEARLVVKKAFDKGYDVIIATTPLLPKTAVIQRLGWAGVADFPYKFITSYENCCANKPNLLYYESILKEISRKANECLMVGDDNKDMVAAKLGIKTFFILNSRIKLDSDTPEPTFRGSLKDLENLI